MYPSFVSKRWVNNCSRHALRRNTLLLAAWKNVSYEEARRAVVVAMRDQWREKYPNTRYPIYLQMVGGK